MLPVFFGAPNNVIIEILLVLLFTLHNTKSTAYHITEVLIFYADKLMVMGNSKNLRVFNFAILLRLRKFDAGEIYIFYYSSEYHWCTYRSAVDSCLGMESMGIPQNTQDES